MDRDFWRFLVARLLSKTAELDLTVDLDDGREGDYLLGYWLCWADVPCPQDAPPRFAEGYENAEHDRADINTV
jgi:hypothetical protein